MSNSKKSYNKWILVGFFTVPVSYLLMIFLLWYLNFFDFTGHEASAKIVGTALTLGGGLVATMVTLIGLILRHTAENRNADLREEAEKRLQIEADRNKDLQEEAERRLKLEAAIRAVDLLGTDAGGDSAETQRTGALFSLAHLGSIDLAVDLVRLMRPAKLLGAEATASILDLGLRSKNIHIQERASEFLEIHFNTLYKYERFEWPQYITFSWPTELSFLSRSYVTRSLMKLILGHPRKEWLKESLNVAIATLIVAFRNEKDPRLKCNIVLFLKKILKIYIPGDALYLPNENMVIGKVNVEVSKADTNLADNQAIGLTNQLTDWINRK